MTFLPVVERELRVASRRRGTYWGRFVAGTSGAALAAWVLLAVDDSEKQIGVDLFAVVSAVVFLYAAVAGTLVTCDCLSEEKREGTLGLLFLTDLKGRDVVLGKLAATSFNAFYGMLAVVPMLGIPFTLGGVSWAEMLRVVLVSLNVLFLFLSLGLFTSALCRKDNWALGLAILIGLALVFGGPLTAILRPFPLQHAVALSSPAAGCILAFDDVYSKKPHYEFWVNAGLTHMYGWIFFVLACRIVPRSWQEAEAGKKTFWRRAAFDARRARRRAELLEVNPFLWRVARFGGKRLLVWLALGGSVVLWWWFATDHWDPGVDLCLLVPVGLVLKAWLAAEASRTLSEDRRSGGLELLLSTPLHERDIVRGQWLAMWRQFAAPVGAVLLAYLLCIIVQIRRNTWLDLRLILKFDFAFGGFLVTDMIALSWVGTWLGLNHRKPNRAALLALTRILALPVGLFFVAISVWATALAQNGNEETAINAAFILWGTLGLGADLWFGLSARAKLRALFRTIAAEGPAGKRAREPAPKTGPVPAEAP